MAKKNVIGTCKLCKKRRILCKSHYLGRALHKLALTNGLNPLYQIGGPRSIQLTP